MEDVGTHSKFPQAPEEKEALLCLLQHCICVSRPFEVLSDVEVLLSPEIHHQLLDFVDVE